MVSDRKRRSLYLKAARHPAALKFDELVTMVEAFGFRETATSRRGGGSHRVFAIPGAPGVLCLQPKGKMAKAYQVRQCVELVERLCGHELTAPEEDL